METALVINLYHNAFKKVKMLELISKFTAIGSQVWILMDILSAARVVRAFLGHQSSELVKLDVTHAETWRKMILKKFLIVKGSSDSMQMFWLKPARLNNH